jgi:hypothetical protein
MVLLQKTEKFGKFWCYHQKELMVGPDKCQRLLVQSKRENSLRTSSYCIPKGLDLRPGYRRSFTINSWLVKVNPLLLGAI